MRNMLLYKLTLEAQRQLRVTNLSKREIIRRLKTSPAQFYRLIDQTNYTKSIDKVLSLLQVLGCDVGIGVCGRLSLDFSRAGSSAGQAVLSAIADVRSAIPEADLIEAAPDFVGLTDVANLLEVSRQNMRKLIVECAAQSPAPIHQGTASIWRLVTVLEWLRDEKNYPIDDSLVALAETTMQVNIAVDVPRIDEAFQETVRGLLARTPSRTHRSAIL